LLGYKPRVGFEDGIRMMVEVKIFFIFFVLVANAIFYSSGGKNSGQVDILREWSLEKTVEIEREMSREPVLPSHFVISWLMLVGHQNSRPLQHPPTDQARPKPSYILSSHPLPHPPQG
jgi:hypothetical protein